MAHRPLSSKRRPLVSTGPERATWPPPTGPFDPDPASLFAKTWPPSALRTPAFHEWALRELNLCGERFPGLRPLVHGPRYEYCPLDHPSGPSGPGVDPAPPPVEILRIAGRAIGAVNASEVDLFSPVLHCPRHWASRGREDLRDFVFAWAVCARAWLSQCVSGRGAFASDQGAAHLTARARELLGVAGLALFVVVRASAPHLADSMALDETIEQIARGDGTSQALREACLTARTQPDPEDSSLALTLARIATWGAPARDATRGPVVEIGSRLRDLYAAIAEALERDRAPPGYERLKVLLGQGRVDGATWSSASLAAGLNELEMFRLLVRHGPPGKRRIVGLNDLSEARLPDGEAEHADGRQAKARLKSKGSDRSYGTSGNARHADHSDHHSRSRRPARRSSR